MQRQFFATVRQPTIRGARTMRHLDDVRTFRLSPEMLAAAALLSLVSVPLIGQLGVLLFIAMTGAIIAVRPRFNFRQLLRFSPLLLLPVLAIASTMWSDAPQRTMRAALELFLTIVAAIVVCRSMRPDRFILTLAAGFLLTALTVAPGVLPSLAGHTALFAWWGSKNQVGALGFTLFSLSVVILSNGQHSRWLRLGSIATAGYGLILAVAAQSGGAFSSVAIFLLVFPPLAMLAAFRLPLRATLGGFAAMLAITMIFFMDVLSAAVTDFRVNVLNKDATLTGRTYLWEFAERLAASHPTLGTGYYAFWRQGNIDAEGLWRWGGAADRAGFNFHNAFVEMRVDLGLVGVWILLLTCAAVLLVALVRQFANPTVPLAYLIALTVVTYFRSYVENGLIAPFSAVTMMWLATILYTLPVADHDAVVAGARGAAIPDRTPGRTPRAPGWLGRITHRRPGRRVIDAGG